MKEKTLLRIALVVSVVGIIGLFIMSKSITVEEAMISRLEQSIDQSVVITGSVVDVRESNSTTFLRIQKDETASVVLFGKAPSVEVGDYIQVRGKVAEHDGETEIIGEEVRVI